MNKKLIIAAVSAAIVAPVVAYADTSATGRVYSKYKTGEEEGSTKSLSNINTDIRLGLKASSDIGNGLTTHAKIELTVKPDSGSNDAETRVSKAGLSGPFGTVEAGQMWSAYYKFGGMVSLSYQGHSYIGSAILRKPNTVKYSNSFGPVSLAVDVRANDSKDSGSVSESGLGVGLSLNPIDALSIGLATDTAKMEDATKADVKNTGLAVRYTLGNGLFGTIGVQNSEGGSVAAPTETDDQFLWIGGPITGNTSWLLGSYEREDKAKVKAKDTTWGIYHTVGGGLAFHYEGTKHDAGDGVAANDADSHTIGMVFSF